MRTMRALAAAALAAVALAAAGCAATDSYVARGHDLGTAAAALVPANAHAFVALDTDVRSSQWQRVDTLTKGFGGRAKLLDAIAAQLRAHGLTWKDDVQPALGNEADVAVLSETEAVLFTKPSDVSKLKALASKVSSPGDEYTVQQIGGWSVVADSETAFSRVRAAERAASLADDAQFKAAWARIGGDALARVYAKPRQANWAAARVSAGDDALRLDASVEPKNARPHAAGTSLLGDVPSGAALAVAFHGAPELLAKLPSLPAAQSAVRLLAPLLTGDGLAYVRAVGLFPQVALEFAPKDPQAALTAARTLLRTATALGGALPLSAQLAGDKLVIADGPAAASALRRGPKLVDDAAYKDAVAAAGVPQRPTFLAYADASALAPFLQLAAQQLTGRALDPQIADALGHLGTVVAWGTQRGATDELHAWIRPR